MQEVDWNDPEVKRRCNGGQDPWFPGWNDGIPGDCCHPFPIVLAQ